MIIDLINAHHAISAEMPHTLGYAGSVYTDAPSWKEAHTAKNDRVCDRSLWIYNAFDVAINARCIEPIMQAAELRNQFRIVKLSHEIQKICVGLHVNGLLVDQKKRFEYDLEYFKKAQKYREAMREISGLGEKLNPNSVPQIADLLFEKWKLPIFSRSEKTDDPSTDDETIRHLMFRVGADRKIVMFLDQLRRYRQAVKFRGTYITKMRSWTDLVEVDEFSLDQDEDPEAVGEKADPEKKGEIEQIRKDRKKKKKAVRRGIVCPADGRMRPHYLAHGTSSNRLSSNTPNAQNYPVKLRDMIVPQRGCCFVYADESQLELRAVANLAKCKNYIEVFQGNGDPHAITARAIFGKEGEKCYQRAVEKYGKKFKEDPDFDLMRTFSKRFVYACLYGAVPKTVWESIIAAEDDRGNLIYKDVTFQEAKDRRQNWLDANPEIESWWQATVEDFRRNGFLAEPIHGWRRDFLDGEEFNELVNFRCQAMGAALVHDATIALVNDHFPFEVAGPGTGLVHQGHDALMFELPIAQAPGALKILEEAMHRKVENQPVEYCAEAKIYRDWGTQACGKIEDGKVCLLKKHKEGEHKFEN